MRLEPASQTSPTLAISSSSHQRRLTRRRPPAPAWRETTSRAHLSDAAPSRRRAALGGDPPVGGSLRMDEDQQRSPWLFPSMPSSSDSLLCGLTSGDGANKISAPSTGSFCAAPSCAYGSSSCASSAARNPADRSAGRMTPKKLRGLPWQRAVSVEPLPACHAGRRAPALAGPERDRAAERDPEGCQNSGSALHRGF